MKLPKFFGEKGSKRRYFVAFTAIFILTALLVFGWFTIKGKTFIWYSDGWEQHYKAYVYYGRYLRSIASELFVNHRFAIPQWDFAIGEGGDILHTLHYYVIGDPFAALSVFAPTRFMWVYYGLMCLLRIYLAGIAFSSLCFYVKKNADHYAVLAGALSYVFCYWSIFNVARHPFFLNPLLYMPMIVLGIERILRERKPFLFIFSIFLAAISNFYYFYNIAIITAIYVIVRLVAEHKKKIKVIAIDLAKIAMYALLGVLTSAVILLPNIFAFLGDSRMGATDISSQLFYPASYYSGLISTFFTGGGVYWLCMGYAVPVFFAIALLFRQRKKYALLKILLAVAAIIIIFPTIGQFFNGMSYMSNKWSWALALLCSYVLFAMWPEMMKLKDKAFIFLAIALCGCLVLAMLFYYSRNIGTIVAICLAFAFLLIIAPRPRALKRKNILCIAVTVASISWVGVCLNSPIGADYVSESIGIRNINEFLYFNEAQAVSDIATDKSDFYRYSAQKSTYNAGLVSGVSGANYYWTLSNPYINQFRRELGLLEDMSEFRHYNNDDRAALDTLSSVKYYTIPNTVEKQTPPYGFAKISDGTFSIYENKYFIPLAYAYDKVITHDDWSVLSSLEKQEAMLQGVYIEDYDGDLDETELSFSGNEVKFDVDNSDGVKLDLNNRYFAVSDIESLVEISYERLENSEVYLVINGLDYDNEPYSEVSISKVNIFIESSQGLSKSMLYNKKESSYYNDRHDFVINLGYIDGDNGSVKLSFSNPGTYSFDSLEIVSLSMDRYPDMIASLADSSLDNVEIGANIISGDISLTEDKILLFTIPYAKGWKAYVDGNEVDIHRANIRYMALDLAPGEHEVLLKYETPYFKLGAILSALGVAICIVLFAWARGKLIARQGRKSPSKSQG